MHRTQRHTTCHLATRNNYASFFERRTEVCGGEPVVKGTRVTVRTVLASLAEGATGDENLPESLLASLRVLGHEEDNVRLPGLAGHSDPDVWQAAPASGRCLITQDLDFSDIRRFAPGTHHGLVLLRLRLPGRQALASRLVNVFNTEAVEARSHCFVLVTDRKIRVHRTKS